MASTVSTTSTTPASTALTTRPGRWIDGWNAEDPAQWAADGRRIAKRNLGWSIFAEFLGFVVWQLWSIVVVMLPDAGFAISASEQFWLISVPTLVGATLRFPYTFAVARFGGRNWTIVSACLLLVPAILLGIVVQHPEATFWLLLVIAALSGVGGGNFASSMANITYFFPQKEKGWALGLNAAGGNLGAAVAQLLVPIVVTLGAAGTLNLGLAGFVWIPLIVVAIVGAWMAMDNISTARSDFAGVAAALREPHLWIMAVLYIGTFGSFIGFAGVFPKLIRDQFPDFSEFHIGTAALSLAFLGALVGSLARPYGGRLADRIGGARMTIVSFAVMIAATIAVVATLPLGSFWLFLGLFLVLFCATGIGNGATYRMIPSIFAARGAAKAGEEHGVSTQRQAAAATGIIAAIGAYGGFLIPQVLNASQSATGAYTAAFWAFVALYAGMAVLTAVVYLVPRASLDRRIV
ncbi:MFS transporter [Microbacterium indicum]|uniref:MFS transporter n=1 Tax=Microbacterium indicum TaxID=358100 RepID=UPI00040892EC|nr:nitrate/nitrite transporter [Microbacterium indicum]